MSNRSVNCWDWREADRSCKYAIYHALPSQYFREHCQPDNRIYHWNLDVQISLPDNLRKQWFQGNIFQRTQGRGKNDCCKMYQCGKFRNKTRFVLFLRPKVVMHFFNGAMSWDIWCFVSEHFITLYDVIDLVRSAKARDTREKLDKRIITKFGPPSLHFAHYLAWDIVVLLIVLR